MAQEAATQTKWAGPWAEVFLSAPFKEGQAPNNGGCTNTTGKMNSEAERVGYGLVGDISLSSLDPRGAGRVCRSSTCCFARTEERVILGGWKQA